MSIAEKLQTIAENEQRVYEAGKAHGETVGKKAQYDEFWDNFQNYGNRNDYNNAFFGKGWNDISYNPKYPIISKEGNGSNATFSYTLITDTKVPIDISKSTSTDLFGNAYKLVTIRKLVVSETSKHNRSFLNCNALENLTIEGVIGTAIDLQYSTKLSKASITSVINALSPTASGLTATFSKTAVNKAFETASGANDGTTSTEWLALRGTKSNWTISLV